MEFFTAYNFIRKHGWDKFQRFAEMMNSGASLRMMSAEIGLSMSQLSRYREALFETRYIPRLGTQKAMDEFIERDQRRGSGKQQFKMVLIGGAR